MLKRQKKRVKFSPNTKSTQIWQILDITTIRRSLEWVRISNKTFFGKKSLRLYKNVQHKQTDFYKPSPPMTISFPKMTHGAQPTPNEPELRSWKISVLINILVVFPLKVGPI